MEKDERELLNKRVERALKDGFDVIEKLGPVDIRGIIESEKEISFKLAALGMILDLMTKPVFLEYERIVNSETEVELEGLLGDQDKMLQVLRGRLLAGSIANLATTVRATEGEKDED